ncbi:acireductone synthase [Spirulina sp. 06S082]|uniref:acireductone synthase n=1 Tax=Spirulina sp. 06S082 TaxID=3110248 RepID=UPI002B1EE4B8|nr:acireductone synthase [Spirulina sp. 06S082]MEA5470305.1 acireductone synthase [Spirulina sp. 06S082]
MTITLTGVSYILLDIEGTTSDIQFVHKVMFPYSRERLKQFVLEAQNLEVVTTAIALTKQTVKAEKDRDIELNEAIEILIEWIDSDRKHPALKSIQGLIWQEGFESGAFHSHLYPDVKPRLEEWQRSGLRLGIYSSGSIGTQKMFFSHTLDGDLTPLFSHYFDLTTGNKKEALSYQKIVKILGFSAAEIVFFSDVPAELEAAREIGLQVIHVKRSGTESWCEVPEVESFQEVFIHKG